jgi:nucleotide-binding universal stress UspA family protein
MASPTIVLPDAHTPAWTQHSAETLVQMEHAQETEVVILSLSEEQDSSFPGGPMFEEGVERDGVVDAAKSVLSSTPFSVRTVHARTADRSVAVLEAFDRVDADHAYMYARNRTPAGKAVFGSTIEEVIAGATIPIVVVPPQGT